MEETRTLVLAQLDTLMRRAFYAGAEFGRSRPAWRDLADAHLREAYDVAQARGFALEETESLANRWAP